MTPNKQDPNVQWIDTKLIDMEGGKIKHETLPPHLIERIRKFSEALSEIITIPIEETIKNFQYDTNPESEVLIWENIAKNYLEYTSKHPGLSREKKKELLGIFLAGPIAPSRPGGYKHFTIEEVIQISQG